MAQTEHGVIEVRGLVKRFGSLNAVDGISLDVVQGEVFGILGPNGAGKTTAMECIEGLQNATSGSIRVLGLDLPKEAGRVKDRIGIQLQASAYFDYLNLREILKLLGSFYGKRASPDALLAKVGLQEKASTPVGKLSGGQKQRFAIAATLVNDPELVFLDEPTTGLDPKARRGLWEFIQSVHGEGHTVVLTTHYMEEAQFLCQRVAIMDRGKIVALDAPDKLIRSLAAPYEITVETDRSQGIDGLAALAAVVGVEQRPKPMDRAITLKSADAARTLPALLAWASKAGASLTRLEVKPANLEDVYLALTGRQLGHEPEETGKKRKP